MKGYCQSATMTNYMLDFQDGSLIYLLIEHGNLARIKNQRVEYLIGATRQFALKRTSMGGCSGSKGKRKIYPMALAVQRWSMRKIIFLSSKKAKPQLVDDVIKSGKNIKKARKEEQNIN